jgi:pimeloyl-ACP methyl ester carboxylesterase
MAQAYSVQEDREPVALPFWTEALVGLEWMGLRTSPVYYGYGVPRGTGEAVVVIPGFLGSDLYLREMYGWLERVGYKAYYSGIGVNADCPTLLMNKLHRTIHRARLDTKRRVHLIGHSLGGLLARSEAARHPELVASVTSLGSPFRGVRAHPNVIQMSDLVKDVISGKKGYQIPRDCFTAYCQCDFVDGLRGVIPDSIPQTAIYTKGDGVVAWDVCLTGDSTIDVEVTGTHCGLAFNPAVYRTLGQRLARGPRPVEGADAAVNGHTRV